MFISSIEVTNFKGIGEETQKFELGPLTMLFGANGVGKSTLLHALGYLYEIVINKNCDPSHLTTCKDIFIGGFEGLIHNHDLDREMKLSIDMVGDCELWHPSRLNDSSLEFLFQQSLMNMGVYYAGIVTPRGFDPIGHCRLELNLKANRSIESKSIVYVSSIKLIINDEVICRIEGHSEYSNTVKYFNYDHKILQLSSDSPDYTEWGINNKTENTFSSILKEYFEQIFVDDVPDNNETHHDFSILGRNLEFDEYSPFFINELTSDYDEIWSDDGHDFLNITTLLMMLIFHPVKKLEGALQGLLHIGPIRIVPTAYFEPTCPPKQDEWYNGKGAWDSLIYNKSLVNNVNSLLLELGIHYSVLITGTSKMPLLRLLNNRNNVEISPTDTGVGISQLMPILVAIKIGDGTVLIEQPELHIHPKLQLKLADIFIKSAILPKKQLSNMTESEYIESEQGKSDTAFEYYFRNDYLQKDNHTVESSPHSVEKLTLCIDDSIRPIESPFINSYRRLIYLHRHCGINDDIIETIKSFEKCNRQFVIETHSEHLILRFLRRIREADVGKRLDDIYLMPSQIKINCLSTSRDNKLYIENIRITHDGDFNCEWPEGFFDERDEELF